MLFLSVVSLLLLDCVVLLCSLWLWMVIFGGSVLLLLVVRLFVCLRCSFGVIVMVCCVISLVLIGLLMSCFLLIWLK